MLAEGIPAARARPVAPLAMRGRGDAARHHHGGNPRCAALCRACLGGRGCRGHRPRPGARRQGDRRDAAADFSPSTIRSIAPRIWIIAVGHVMSPPYRPKAHQEAIRQAIEAGMLSTTGTDHCCFTKAQKRLGRDDFTKISNGCGGVEERLHVLWHLGVNGGRLTPENSSRLPRPTPPRRSTCGRAKARWRWAPTPT